MTDFGRVQPHKATHQSGGADEIDLTSLEGKSQVVDGGNPLGWHYNIGDFTTDGSYHDLDLSAYVPVGAKFVLLRVNLLNSTANKACAFRKNGISQVYNNDYIYCQVAWVSYSQNVIVAVDDDRVIEYAFASGGWSQIDISIAGWIL